MDLSGALLIGGEAVFTERRFVAIAPATGDELAVAFSAAGPDEVESACAFAAEASNAMRAIGADRRAMLLDTIADKIEAIGDPLLERAHLESGLPLARITGERGRTVAQLRLFATELRGGGWQRIRIDTALPDRQPLARPDLRMLMIPLGPVAVFGASNFPLAFSVAGGDTAAALAAGCPVIAKGHSAHPGTSELIGRAIAASVRECGFPPGTFSLLQGEGNALGGALVADPRLAAVGFTGSRSGGLALMKIAADRPVPIPVYAEMSSINPVILFPDALATRAETLAQDFVSSMTLGVGQFCTNPGLVLAIDSPFLKTFERAAANILGSVPAAPMLTSGIHRAYEDGIAHLAANPNVETVARGIAGDGPNRGQAALFAMNATQFLTEPGVRKEVFGASSLLVRCADETELAQVVADLEGQLTTTLHFTDQDQAAVEALLPALEGLAGRLVANSWPTGVEVSHAMVHGGPYPSTSDGRSTSVGTLAIERFLRPVCYQGFPDNLLPSALRNGAQSSIPHRLDGADKA